MYHRKLWLMRLASCRPEACNLGLPNICIDMNIEDWIAPHLRQMQPYTPIVPLDVLSQRLGIPPERLIKLDANENPYGPSPRALEALARSRELHIYPDPDQTALREAIAAFIGVPMAHILCGAGGDEVIDLIARAFVQPGEAVLDLPPTFGMYKWQADIMGARYVKVPRRADFSIDIDAVERQHALTPAKLLFVTNPNNPDGCTTARADLLRLLKLPVMVSQRVGDNRHVVWRIAEHIVASQGRHTNDAQFFTLEFHQLINRIGARKQGFCDIVAQYHHCPSAIDLNLIHGPACFKFEAVDHEIVMRHRPYRHWIELIFTIMECLPCHAGIK